MKSTVREAVNIGSLQLDPAAYRHVTGGRVAAADHRADVLFENPEADRPVPAESERRTEVGHLGGHTTRAQFQDGPARYQVQPKEVVKGNRVFNRVYRAR